jgi:Stringent starvation protein B
MIVAPELASAKPYLLRAMYEWCCEQGLTPYMAVFVDEQVKVPQEFVRDNEITLNVGMDAPGCCARHSHHGYLRTRKWSGNGVSYFRYRAATSTSIRHHGSDEAHI